MEFTLEDDSLLPVNTLQSFSKPTAVRQEATGSRSPRRDGPVALQGKHMESWGVRPGGITGRDHLVQPFQRTQRLGVRLWGWGTKGWGGC